jgi:hypothetical protein
MTVELTKDTYEFKSKLYGAIFWACWAMVLLLGLVKALRAS